MPIDFSPLMNVLLISSAASPLVALASRASRKPLLSGFFVSAVLLYSFFTAIGMFSESLLISPSPPSSSIFIDSLALYMSVIILGIATASSIYSLGYLKNRQAEFFPLLLLLVLGMIGVFLAGDLITFFVFWELMSISSYMLVAFNYREWEAVEASLKYLIMSSTGSAAILFGMSLLYGMVGSLSFAELSASLSSEPAGNELWSVAALVFIIGGLGVNVAMAPFHSWLPDAHPAAPSPISAMLSGVVIKTGIYGMFRFLSMLFPQTIYDWQFGLALMSVLTMSVGNLLASLQSDIKRLLAFSSIANIGYIIFAIAIGSELGFTGGLLHVLNHAISKALLFLAAGAFIYAAGTRDIEQLAGIGKRMPISAITYAVGAFSLAGIPGLNSFVSEYTILYAAFSTGMYAFAAIMIINILIGAVYHMRVVATLFLKPETERSSTVRESSKYMLAPLLVLAALNIIIGVYASPFLGVARSVAVSLF